MRCDNCRRASMKLVTTLLLISTNAAAAMTLSTPTIQLVTGSTLHDVTSFFAEAFWLSSTTVDAVQLQKRERAQLEQRMSTEFTSRYGCSWETDSKARGRLFRARLLFAREADGDSAAVIGCVGIEAALFELSTGRVLPSASAEAIVRRALDYLDDDEANSAAELYRSGGVGALSQDLLPDYMPVALMANLAVDPRRRRTGVARELCELCEAGCSEWALPGMMLQVEEGNAAARGLYERLGYEVINTDRDATALRCIPGQNSLASAFLFVENNDLLQDRPATILTMAKQQAGDASELETEGSS